MRSETKVLSREGNGGFSKKLTLRKADAISMNVIVSIGYLEVDILEQIQSEDADFNILNMDLV